MPGNSRSVYVQGATLAQVESYLRGKSVEPKLEQGKIVYHLPTVRIEFTEQGNGVLVSARCKPYGAVDARNALDSIAKDLALLRSGQNVVLGVKPQKEILAYPSRDAH